MLAGAFSCRHLNAHRSDEYIVPEASDGDVADAACPSRILLVEQQVSLTEATFSIFVSQHIFCNTACLSRVATRSTINCLSSLQSLAFASHLAPDEVGKFYKKCAPVKVDTVLPPSREGIESVQA
jgi:hypothetical protein